MEIRVLVKNGLCISLISLALSCAFAPPAFADENEERRWVRFYKANRALQTDRIFFTGKKGKQLGCHNLVKKTRVYKLVQYGFGHCKIYTAKDCQADALATAMREKDDSPSTSLAQGYGWYPVSEHPRGAKIRSWSCGTEQAPPPPKPKKKPKPAEPLDDAEDQLSDEGEEEDSKNSKKAKKSKKPEKENP